MSRIQGRDTGPERKLRSSIWARGLRYRLNARVSGCRPDLIFPGPRVAVFVDGCFWHGCPEHYVPPRSSRTFWAEKLDGNVRRDSRQTGNLESAGWRVVRIWEHDIRRDPEPVAHMIEQIVRGDLEPPLRQPRVIRVEFVDEVGDHEARHLVNLKDLQPVEVVRRRRITRKL